MMVKKLVVTVVVLTLLIGNFPQADAQSTARGSIISYNASNDSAVLDLNESDLRYNQIDINGGIIAITNGTLTREAYFLPSDLEQSTDLANLIRLKRVRAIHRRNSIGVVCRT